MYKCCMVMEIKSGILGLFKAIKTFNTTLFRDLSIQEPQNGQRMQKNQG